MTNVNVGIICFSIIMGITVVGTLVGMIMSERNETMLRIERLKAGLPETEVENKE